MVSGKWRKKSRDLHESLRGSGDVLVRATESGEEENGVCKVASARQWASAKSGDSVRGSRKKSVGNDNERLPWRDNRQVSYLDRKPRAYAYTYVSRLVRMRPYASRVSFVPGALFLTLLLTDGFAARPPGALTEPDCA